MVVAICLSYSFRLRVVCIKANTELNAVAVSAALPAAPEAAGASTDAAGIEADVEPSAFLPKSGKRSITKHYAMATQLMCMEFPSCEAALALVRHGAGFLPCENWHCTP